MSRKLEGFGTGREGVVRGSSFEEVLQIHSRRLNFRSGEFELGTKTEKREDRKSVV